LMSSNLMIHRIYDLSNFRLVEPTLPSLAIMNSTSRKLDETNFR